MVAGYDCRSYINVPAGPGRMATVNNSNNITRLSAKAVADDSVYSLAYNFDNTTND